MGPSGIEGLFLETHNWGKSVAFWKALGYEIDLDTGHHSGQLRHPAGGPYLFIAERPEGQPLQPIVPVLRVEEAGAFVPPASGTVARGFEPQHWGTQELLLADPDGRRLSIQAPPQEARTEAPA